MKKKSFRLTYQLMLLLAMVSMSLSSLAQNSDIPNSHDHPLLQRFQGSRLTAYLQTEWAEVRLPQAKTIKQDGAKSIDWNVVEGKETRLHYLSPVGKTVLEVHRNYRDALLKAGIQLSLSCEQNCEDIYRQWLKQAAPFERQFKWDSGHVNGFSHYDAPDRRESQFIVGYFSPSSRGPKTHVLVLNSIGFGGTSKVPAMTSTFIQIIEEKAQPNGQVSVNAEALNQSLQNSGHVSLYGLLFDTGKTELRAESQTQLAELTKMLKSQNSLNVIIVGHTDNVGNIDANLNLSQARAQTIVQALIQAGIDKRRLLAKGVANFAPVASNANEDGRALNRRVEVVAQ